jgi:peptidoglycan/LPS O-acetylase OafA/YrhL
MVPPAGGVSSILKDIAGWWIQVGWIGVDLFFVLSGFLVSGLLFSEYQQHGGVNVARFLVRRGLKIYPAFYFMIFVTVMVTIFASTFDGRMAAALVPELLYVQNYFPGIWGHTWSLAVEEHFYVLLTLSVCMLARKQPNAAQANPFGKFLRLAIFTVGAITVARTVAPYVAVYTGTAIDPTQLRYETHARIDTLIVGVILSYLFHFHRARLMNVVGRYRTTIMIGSVLLLIPPFLWPLGQSEWLPSIGLLSIAVGFGGVLLTGLPSVQWAGRLDLIVSPLTAALAFIGFHSYSVYLWHRPVQAFLMPYVSRSVLPRDGADDLIFLADTGVYLAASFLVGITLGRLLEQPALRLRDRLFPSRTGGIGVPRGFRSDREALSRRVDAEAPV